MRKRPEPQALVAPIILVVAAESAARIDEARSFRSIGGVHPAVEGVAASGGLRTIRETDSELQVDIGRLGRKTSCGMSVSQTFPDHLVQ